MVGARPWCDDGVVSDDRYALDRFVTAQAPVIETVFAELAAGEKRSHWMWFVFPQFAGLGRSETARFYGIASRDEALAYWRHPVLGPRLLRCCDLLLPHAARGAERVLGPVDAVKLRSCLTLFEQVAPEEPVFGELLEDFFAGERDAATLALLADRR
jgi:uncharacterized protein (DUF1810 family)